MGTMLVGTVLVETVFVGTVLVGTMLVGTVLLGTVLEVIAAFRYIQIQASKVMMWQFSIYMYMYS